MQGSHLRRTNFRLIVWKIAAFIYCVWLIDDHLYSAILRSLEQTHCAHLWFYKSDKLFFNGAFFWISTEVVYLSAGMAGGTWNCSHLGASSVYTIQPCIMCFIFQEAPARLPRREGGGRGGEEGGGGKRLPGNGHCYEHRSGHLLLRQS